MSNNGEKGKIMDMDAASVLWGYSWCVNQKQI